MKEDFILVIPARLESTRLSKKLLIEIEGKSIIERTYNQALIALKDKDKIIIATDSRIIIFKKCFYTLIKETNTFERNSTF